MIKLNDLLNYDHITAQCHDNPDPDTIGSAFALYKFFTGKDKDTQIIYSGAAEVILQQNVTNN